MTNYPVMLEVPDYVYERALRIAHDTARPVETVLAQQLAQSFSEPLPALPPDEQAELAALSNLSDAALWTIAAERMLPMQQDRLSLLLALNKRVVLSDLEQNELDDLLDSGDRLTLRKAEAAAILTRRGYTVTPVTFRSS